MKLDDLKIKIFADGADIETIKKLAANPLISGFTTNPSLCRRAGVTDYAAFAKEVVKLVAPRPVSFEVFADETTEMVHQAEDIASWGKNVFVKIPITDTRGKILRKVIRRLVRVGVNLNITAITTKQQISAVSSLLHSGEHFISVFAGRIADTGRNPDVVIRHAIKHTLGTSNQVIWASPREVLNVYQADRMGCHVITATPDILAKLPLCGKDLTEYSLETVRMFHNDAAQAGYVL